MYDVHMREQGVLILHRPLAEFAIEWSSILTMLVVHVFPEAVLEFKNSAAVRRWTSECPAHCHHICSLEYDRSVKLIRIAKRLKKEQNWEMMMVKVER